MYKRRVQLIGKIPQEEVEKLSLFLRSNRKIRTFINNSNSLMGLNNWVKTHIETTAEVFCYTERDSELTNELRIIAETFPNLILNVHFSDTVGTGTASCINTVVIKGGNLSVKDPMIDRIPRVSGKILSEHLNKTLDEVRLKCKEREGR